MIFVQVNVIHNITGLNNDHNNTPNNPLRGM